MATVYEAIHEGLDKPVALKVLHEGLVEDPDYLQRFLREARAAARLNHPNVVRAYEAGEHGGRYYFSMELVEGEDLGERLAREVTLPEDEALRVCAEVCAALSAAEEHGIVHRDIKPENVLVRPDGRVKLADLGLAKVRGDGHLTAEGYTLGTVAFFSPEQCRGSSSLDVRSDLFALGSLLYTLVSGELPFGRGENAPLTMQRIIEEEAPPIAAAPPTLRVLRRLMAKDASDRPATAEEARALLLDALAELRGERRPPSPSRGSGSSGDRPGLARARRRRRRYARPSSTIAPELLVVLVGLTLLLGLVFAVVARGASSPAPEPRGRGAAHAAAAEVR